MKTAVKWLDAKGEETQREKATQALISEYDDEGNLVRETWGMVDNNDEDEVE